MHPALRATKLTKRYEALTAVDGIDFEVPRGTTFGFLGPNGAGKSSTMRMIVGLSPPSGGSLEVLGHDVVEDLRDVKRRIGVVLQDNNLDVDMTARENLVAYARFFDLTGAKGAARADELLEFMGLAAKADARVEDLSGGMRRRLMIARALLHDPELLILDEPTTGLDPQSRNRIWEKILAFRAQGKTVLLSTHYMEEAERLCDALVILHKGKIVARGRPADLVREHIGREVLELAFSDATQRFPDPKSKLVRGIDRLGDTLLLQTDEGEKLLAEILASGVKPQRTALRRATLEDVFLKLTGRKLED
ncbi:MAG: ABC transporter ATP-binding protein [Thermoplasmatota archaeon]